MPPVAPDAEPFAVLRRLLDAGRCWVKLSAPYESEHDDRHRYREVGRLVRVLVATYRERLLWASNWPHPGQANPPSAADLHRLALEWMPDATTRRCVLVDNPAKLYAFDAP
jgi:D-galactarolactone isomerase